MIDKWCYICPDAKNGLHHWVKGADGCATCKHCKLELNETETIECFTQR